MAEFPRDGAQGFESQAALDVPRSDPRVMEGTPEDYETRAAEAESSAAYWRCMAKAERSPNAKALQHPVAKEYHAEARMYRKHQKRASLEVERSRLGDTGEVDAGRHGASPSSRLLQWLRTLLSTDSRLITVCLLVLCAATPASAQWKDKVTRAAKGTGVGKAVTNASVEAEMIDATRIDLEQSGLPTLVVGSLSFGIAAVEIKNDRGVRVHAYLLNPTSQDAAVPLPDPTLFVLVDSKGRRLERVSGVSVDKLPRGSTEITVPSIERVKISVLFAGGRADAPTGTLKVGAIGTIGGIPVHTSGAPQSISAASSSAAGGNVWTQPSPSAPSAPPAPVPTPASDSTRPVTP